MIDGMRRDYNTKLYIYGVGFEVLKQSFKDVFEFLLKNKELSDEQFTQILKEANVKVLERMRVQQQGQPNAQSDSGSGQQQPGVSAVPSERRTDSEEHSAGNQSAGAVRPDDPSSSDSEENLDFKPAGE